jgi:hypothetical protein
MISKLVLKFHNVVSLISAISIVSAATLVLVVGASAQATEKVLLDFGDPFRDQGTLIWDSKGNLYGTTPGSSGTDYGSVFELQHFKNGTWGYKLLYRFSGGSDGAYPRHGLVLDGAGNLYGAAEIGGTHCSGGACWLGVIFELTATLRGEWTENAIYEFIGGTDGAFPSTGLISDTAGNLYGATQWGYPYVNGVVYKLTRNPDATWAEQTLYGFPDRSGLTLADTGRLMLDSVGNLYGTTGSGGGGGAVVELSPVPTGPWNLTVLHTFCTLPGCKDGEYPTGGVTVDDRGNLYGATGGSHLPNVYGTAFELSPKKKGGWIYHLLYSFCKLEACADGSFPSGGLVLDAGGNIL